MKFNCVNECGYYQECFTAEIRTSNLTEGEILHDLIQEGDLCLNDPRERPGYNPENYRGCGVLGAALHAVQAASEEQITESPALTFYQGFFSEPE